MTYSNLAKISKADKEMTKDEKEQKEIELKNQIRMAQSNVDNCEICKSRKRTNYEPQDDHGCESCEIANEILVDHISVVKKVASGYDRSYVSVDDLMADGILGLYQAIYTFDPSKNVKFETYAYKVINSFIRVSDLLFGLIDLPRDSRTLQRKISSVKLELLRDLHREPTLIEILDYIDANPDYTNINKQHVIEFENGRRGGIISSMDKEIATDEEKEITMHDTIGEYDKQYKTIEAIDQVKFIMDRLTSDERKIIGHTYGILGYDHLSSNEIIDLLDKPITRRSLLRKEKDILKMAKDFEF